jgi:hypothetical protein
VAIGLRRYLLAGDTGDDIIATCRAAVTKAGWVQRSGNSFTEPHGINTVALVNIDWFHGDITDRLVYLRSPAGLDMYHLNGAAPDLRSPYVLDWTLPVKDTFLPTYGQMGYNTGVLGAPISTEYAAAGGGLRQDFVNGYLHAVSGTVFAYFNNARVLTFRSLATGSDFYVSGEMGYAEPNAGLLRARAGSMGSWEKWRLVQLDNGDVAVQSQYNSKYVTAEIGSSGTSYARLRARSATVGPWERFRIVYNADGSYSLVSVANGKYVTVETVFSGTLSLALRATAAGIGQNEKFTESTNVTAASLAPQVTTLENNTSHCGGTVQWFSSTDGNGHSIGWTYANGTYQCISVDWYPTPPAGKTCRYDFYVPKGHATANLSFKVWYLWDPVNDIYKFRTVTLNEAPVDGWVRNAFSQHDVIVVSMGDNNGQTGTQIGWGMEGSFSLHQAC